MNPQAQKVMQGVLLKKQLDKVRESENLPIEALVGDDAEKLIPKSERQKKKKSEAHKDQEPTRWVVHTAIRVALSGTYGAHQFNRGDIIDDPNTASELRAAGADLLPLYD